MLDLGTGSGAIALAIKRHRPHARVVAVDASAAALEVARRNAVRFTLEVDFRHGRWFEPLAGERFDLIVSNPPYVAAGDPHLPACASSRASALVAGADGLDAIREIDARARAHLSTAAGCCWSMAWVRTARCASFWQGRDLNQSAPGPIYQGSRE